LRPCSARRRSTRRRSDEPERARQVATVSGRASRRPWRRPSALARALASPCRGRAQRLSSSALTNSVLHRCARGRESGCRSRSRRRRAWPGRRASVARRHDGLVVDDETVDVQAVADDAALGRRGGTCCFHGYRVAPWQADLTERTRSTIYPVRGAPPPPGPARLPDRRPRRAPPRRPRTFPRRRRRGWPPSSPTSCAGPAPACVSPARPACDIKGTLTVTYNMRVYLRLKSKTVATEGPPRRRGLDRHPRAISTTARSARSRSARAISCRCASRHRHGQRRAHDQAEPSASRSLSEHRIATSGGGPRAGAAAARQLGLRRLMLRQRLIGSMLSVQRERGRGTTALRCQPAGSAGRPARRCPATRRPGAPSARSCRA
jgi:hypothetical protein